MRRKRSRHSSRAASRHKTEPSRLNWLDKGKLGKQSEAPSFLLIEGGIKERNYVDKRVCHLQDSSLQISPGREGALPVWVGMGYLAIKSEDFRRSKQYTANNTSLASFPQNSRPG